MRNSYVKAARGIPSPVAQKGGERAGEPMGNAGSVAQVQIRSQGVVRREAQMAPSQGTWSSASGSSYLAAYWGQNCRGEEKETGFIAELSHKGQHTGSCNGNPEKGDLRSFQI